jgi:hypothetical protein
MQKKKRRPHKRPRHKARRSETSAFLTNIKATIEFHDSEVAAVTQVDGALHIRFSAAYVHRAAEAPGMESGEGYVLAVELRLATPVGQGDWGVCQGKLSDGVLSVDNAAMGCVPLPYEAVGRIRLCLAFSNGAELVVEASSVVLTQAGTPRFVEVFKC